MALILVGSVDAAVAVPAATVAGCNAYATSFAVQADDGPVGLRMGCARDAGSLRPLANHDDDLLLAFDFDVPQRRDQVRALMADWVAETRADRAAGIRLGDSLSRHARENSVGLYPPHAGTADFDGHLAVSGDSLVMVISTAEIGTTANWWQKWIAAGIGLAIQIVATAICLLAFNVGAPAAAPVCGAVGGGLGALIGELMNAYYDHRSLGDRDVWTEALSVAFWGAVGGALGGQLLEWASTGATSLVTKTQVGLRNLATRVGNMGKPLIFIANNIGGMGPALYEHILRLSRGVGRAVRVMTLGDSITKGLESSDGNGYRDEFYARLESIFGKGKVNFVGSQNSGSMADRDHEGHPGKRIDQIATFADCTVQPYKPNVIALLAGTNDADQNFQLSSAPQRLKNLITQVLNDSPRAVVAVAEVTPTGKRDMQPRIDAINAALPGIVNELQAVGKHVLIAHTGDLKVSDGLETDSHPDDAGYAKLGADFGDAVQRAEDLGWIQGAEPSRPAGACTGPTGHDDATALGFGWRALGTVAPGFGAPVGRTMLAELNGDKRADYVQVDDKGRFRIAMNTVGAPGKPNWVDNWGVNTMPRTEEKGEPGDTVRFADIDGDGRDDYLIVGSQGKVTAWVNKSTSATLKWNDWGVVVPSEKVKQDHVRFADLNGDARDDYIQVGDNGSAHVYFNTPGKGGRPKWVLKSNWIPGTAESSIENVRFGDVDGDGRSDYLEVGRAGAVHAFLNRGTMDTPHFERHLNFAMESGYDGSKIQFADISGDGKADYVVVYDGGSVRGWLNRAGNI